MVPTKEVVEEVKGWLEAVAGEVSMTMFRLKKRRKAMGKTSGMRVGVWEDTQEDEDKDKLEGVEEEEEQVKLEVSGQHLPKRACYGMVVGKMFGTCN